MVLRHNIIPEYSPLFAIFDSRHNVHSERKKPRAYTHGFMYTAIF
jgi:hypothetical protein